VMKATTTAGYGTSLYTSRHGLRCPGELQNK
jgi:hypothetical protein